MNKNDYLCPRCGSYCKDKIEKEDFLKDGVGKRPEIKDVKHGIQLILDLAKDKRSHILYPDAFNWERLKMKEVKSIANILLKTYFKD